ncbi:MAG: arginine--tRNA ligase [Actinobacteria bacterium]|nr:arginine--tRNA ligase [Actinomycetota bacterium]
MTDSGSASPSLRSDPLAALRRAVNAAAAGVVGAAEAPSGVALERPRKAAHGDFATNAAMVCAPVARDNPRNVARKIGEALAEQLGVDLGAAEVAGPGFLNLRLADGWYRDALAFVLSAPDRFGAGVAESPERINVEFVSANPTGPMHLGHGRNAAYGDSLCRIFEFAGHEVSREFYINDFGSQVARFGASISARARGEHVPEDGYQGEYVDEIAAAIDGAAELEESDLAQRGVAMMIERIRATLERMGVRIDTWFSERTLLDDGRFERALDTLAAASESFEHDGALWLRTSKYGDDKDRVLRRTNGEYTYFSTDIAYHADKYARGFKRLIDVWGADHHGYVARMKSAVAALGGDPDTFEPVIMQLVNLTENGKRVQMSKRSGEFVPVDDLIEDIGADALRFFMVQRSHETTMDLDLALAREQSDKNPVYYVQYAHARIASILRKAGEPGAPEGEGSVEPAAPVTGEAAGQSVPAADSAAGVAAQAVARSTAGAGHELHASERALIRKLIEFPDEIAETCLRRAPHRLTIYGRDLAAEFSAFYRDCKVIGDDAPVQEFRLALCRATRDTLARTLDLLGVSAPQSM